jgi:hypothetical protein
METTQQPDCLNISKVFYTYNPSTQEAKAGESQTLGHPRLHNKTLTQKKNDNNNVIK